MSKANFITLEGGEGAGKTTLLNTLEEMLSAQGISVVRTREPGGTPFGDEVRRWLLSHQSDVKIGSKAELLLFLASRAQHIEEVIAPALAAGKVVLCDRFNDSTVAYQGSARGLGAAWVRSLCNSVCGDVLPGLTLYLDVDPKIGLERTRGAAKENAASGNVDRIESEKFEFHQRVREAFLAISKQEPKRFYPIDALRPQTAVWQQAKDILSAHLKMNH